MIPHLRRLARHFGYDLSPLKKARDLDRQITASLQHHGVELVVDVGANAGQYAERLRLAGWQGPLHSIEPLSDLNRKLERKARRDAQWHIHPPLVLGDRNGSATLERSAESDMSSVLPQASLLQSISPSSAVSATIEVPMQRFENLNLGSFDTSEALFLKLDVQGFERTVLDGIGRRWPQLKGLQLEMALVPLYEGEALWHDLIAMLDERGFALCLLLPGYFEPKLARQLQCDGVFFRRSDSLS